MDFIQEMMDALHKLPDPIETESEIEYYNRIMEVILPDLERIQVAAVRTVMYTEGQAKFEAYLKAVHQAQDTAEKRAIKCFDDMLLKINGSPTSMHIIGVVILLVPAVLHFHKLLEDERRKTEKTP